MLRENVICTYAVQGVPLVGSEAPRKLPTLAFPVGANVKALFDWSRTRDEDIHQSSGALLPVRTGRHVRDADKCAEQIEWLQVSANVAALDCALHQRINRSLDLTA